MIVRSAVGLALACSAMLAQTPSAAPSEPTAPEVQRKAAQAFVDGKVGVWRERLKLQDWRISVVLTNDLPARTLGAIHWDKTKKTATIWALDPSGYSIPFPAILDDLELTVVHELVHLDLTSLPRGQASRGSEERAVGGIAGALLELDRRGR